MKVMMALTAITTRMNSVCWPLVHSHGFGLRRGPVEAIGSSGGFCFVMK